jgi:hypothetical protein
MNRRAFLKVTAAVSAALLAPVAWVKRRLKLHGDGVTDDTEALQALLNGEEVEMPDGTMQQMDDAVRLPSRTFRIKDTLFYDSTSKKTIVIKGTGAGITRLSLID